MKKYNCPQCNTEFTVGVKFCQSCGCNLELESIERPVCPKCHKTFPHGAKFCDIDGAKLTFPEMLIPKCVKCGTMYSSEINYCPKDGGEVVVEALLHSNKEQSPPNQLNLDGPYLKASLTDRFFAYLLDIFITTVFAIPSFILYLMGKNKMSYMYGNDEAFPLFIMAAFLYLAPLTYSLIKDGLGKGQSWGKKTLGLMVVYLPNKTPGTIGQSFSRNFVLLLLGIIPLVGWFIEPFLVINTKDGRRFGDNAANTQVIETQYYNN